MVAADRRRIADRRRPLGIMTPDPARTTAEHILFVVGVYPPMIGGVESHVAHLAAALRDGGHRVTVVTITGEPGDRDELGIRVVRLPRRFDVGGIVAFPSLRTARQIARLIRESGVTAVSTHMRLFPMSFIGWRAARLAGVVHVHTEHGSDHVRGVSPLIGFASRLVDTTMGRFILRNADRVLGVSESVLAFVKRLAGVDAGLFYNAIDADAWRGAFVDATSTVGRRRAVFVGRLVPGKGWDDFTSAIAAIADSGEPIDFEAHVLGGGPDLDTCRDAVAAAGLAERVIVHGPVSPNRVRELLSGGILVNPTQLSEGFQTTLLEALAVGAEIVSYPVPGLEALAADGAPMTIVPRGDVPALTDAIRASLRDPRPPLPSDRLDAWSWPVRAAQYIEIVTGARAGTPQP